MRTLLIVWLSLSTAAAGIPGQYGMDASDILLEMITRAAADESVDSVMVAVDTVVITSGDSLTATQIGIVSVSIFQDSVRIEFPPSVIDLESLLRLGITDSTYRRGSREYNGER